MDTSIKLDLLCSILEREGAHKTLPFPDELMIKVAIRWCVIFSKGLSLRD